jgi:hypothetical protein
MAEDEVIKKGVPIVSTTAVLAEKQNQIYEQSPNTETHSDAEPAKHGGTSEVELSPREEPHANIPAEPPSSGLEIPACVVEVPTQQAEVELDAQSSVLDHQNGSHADPAQTPLPGNDYQADLSQHPLPGQFADEQDLEVDVRRVPRLHQQRIRRLTGLLTHKYVLL